MNDPEKNNYPDYIEKKFEFNITHGQKPERLDVFITGHIINASRNKVKQAIDDGRVLVNGRPAKASRKVQPGDEIICTIMKPPPIELIPENIPLDIAYEDEWLLVVNKPAGMVTHPGFGNRYGTLVNALLYHLGERNAITVELDEDDEDNDNSDAGAAFAGEQIRPGIVHRLDKDTSGLLVIAKNSVILAKLQKQFHDRTIHREYNTLVWGNIKDDSGTIEGDIGRSPRDRKLFAVVKKGGKHAITNFEVLARFGILTLLKVKLGTGRTHQIRVHFSNDHHPVLGDAAYGGDKIVHGGGIPSQKKLGEQCLKLAERQMLHARTLGFVHPATGDELFFTSGLPDDMKKVIALLESKSQD